jgi:hypothetical protein
MELKETAKPVAIVNMFEPFHLNAHSGDELSNTGAMSKQYSTVLCLAPLKVE